MTDASDYEQEKMDLYRRSFEFSGFKDIEFNIEQGVATSATFVLGGKKYTCPRVMKDRVDGFRFSRVSPFEGQCEQRLAP